MFFQYKGISEDGKSLIFECIDTDNYFSNSKNKEEFIKWLVNLRYRDTYNNQFYWKVRQATFIFPNYDEKGSEIRKNFPRFMKDLNFDYKSKKYSNQLVSETTNLVKKEFKNNWDKTEISILEQNIYFVSTLEIVNDISIRYNNFIEKEYDIANLKEKINDANSPLKELHEINSNLRIAGDDDYLRFFMPSFFSKYTITTRLVLAPYTVVGSTVFVAGMVTLIAGFLVTLPIWMIIVPEHSK